YMKKILLYIILIVFQTNLLYSQSYNNEWIDYGKTYYKFKVGKTGLYRITQSQLAGLGIGNVDVSQFKLWRNGVEVPLFTSAQSGVLSTSGYLEFWGEMNDGNPDKSLYRKPEYQLNDTKSLFTDTAAFFLTVNATANKRLVPTSFSIPSGAIPEPYFMFTQSGQFFYEINKGKAPIYVTGGTVYYSSFDYGEGFASTPISNNGTMTQAYNNLNVYTGAGAPSTNVFFTAVGITPGNRNVSLNLNGTELVNAPFSGFNWYTYNSSINTASIATGTASFEIKNISASSNQMRVSKLDITYPRIFNFGGQQNFKFQLPASSSGRYLEISNFTYSGTPVLIDLTEGKRYQMDISNPSLLKVFLPAFSATHQLVLVNTAEANVNNVSGFETRNFVNYLNSGNQGNYLIISNPALSTSSFGNNPLEDYKQYRSSVAGGNYQANIYMIDQLVDQFAFGIKFSAVSIRNFARYARDKFTNKPKEMFLLGKAVNYLSARLNESNTVLWQQNFVPTFGYPASDHLLTAEGSSSYPLTPVGRLSVVDGDEINNYLNKVKEYEQLYVNNNGSIDDQFWKKDVAHVVGSNSQIEIEDFYERLNHQKPILIDTFYGARVSDFLKQAINSEQEAASERLKKLFKNGFNLLSYLGHSTATKLTFDLEDPYLYENTNGKYPVLNLLGCDAGDIYGWTTDRLQKLSTISENYILAKGKGSIGLLSGTSYGYTSSVEFYYNQFAKEMSRELYRASIGEIMQKAIKRTFEIYPEEGDNYPFTQTQAEQCVLHGDPAIRFLNQAQPDYAIEDKTISIEPNIISIADGSFKVKAVIYNLGKAVNGKLKITLKRTTPDLVEKIIQLDTIDAIKNMDSIIYTVPINQLTDGGINKITITIDDNNQYDELFETNNTVTKDVFIVEDGIRPEYPYNYQIVGKLPLTFAASTTNPLAESANYLFELDTTALFNSSQKVTQSITSKGGLIEFTPTVNYVNDRVYFWRVAQVPNAGEQPSWVDRSFTYIAGTDGFNMEHYYQMNEADFSNINLNSNRRFEFDSIPALIGVNTGIFPFTGLASEHEFQINDLAVQKWMLAPFSGPNNVNDSTLRFYVVDNKNMKTWDNVDLGTSGMYGSVRPIPAQSNTIPTFFQFKVNTSAQRKVVADFIDLIPNGFYIVITNSPMLPNIPVSNWINDTQIYGSGNTLLDKLNNEGVSILNQIQQNSVFAIFIQKGKGTNLKEAIGVDEYSKVKEKVLVKTFPNMATIETKPIGLAKSWGKFSWDGKSLESNSKDETIFKVYGINQSGSEELLKTFNSISNQKEFDISDINAEEYNKLKINVELSDTANFTPMQLKYLRISYIPMPEGVIAPNLFMNLKDSLLPGEPLSFGVAFKNVSDFNFEKPLKIKLNILDRNNVQNNISVPPQKILVSKDSIKFSYPINTQNLGGLNTAYIEFNADKDQPENNYLNNFLYKSFYVKADSTNPYLDVTFDGVRILNNDIVSSKPHIQVKLTDDAKWALLTDPSLVNIKLRYPNNQIREFNYTSDTLMFEPASGSNQNQATVHFKPYLLDDGKYELIVAGKDASGNKAGDIEYRVQFEVINKSMISNVLNYPNPFTTSTAFVFTLTGAEVPQNIRIQILTITGKIVKEITKQELGPLRIGNNITEYKWDGTDQYGQKLANGVYLYRIITKQN
ncbi:MAG: hypothetical protein E6Q95_00985, partial [Chitinophagaceae bacterium]